MGRLERLQRLAFFPVAKEQNPETGKYAVMDKYLGQKIADVSKGYELVRNEDVVQPFIERFGIDNLTKVQVSNARRSYAFTFNTGRLFEFDGDTIEERLLIRNSYDKTKAFSFMFGAFRWVCSNGLYYAVSSALVYRKIHLGVIPVADLVRNAIENFEKNDFDFYKRLLAVPLSREQELELLGLWTPFEVKENTPQYQGNNALNSTIRFVAERKVLSEESRDNQRNAWGLYNQMNQAIRRNLPRGAINKVILGDQRALQYIGKALNLN